MSNKTPLPFLRSHPPRPAASTQSTRTPAQASVAVQQQPQPTNAAPSDAVTEEVPPLAMAPTRVITASRDNSENMSKWMLDVAQSTEEVR